MPMSDVINDVSKKKSIYFTCVLINLCSVVPKHYKLFSPWNVVTGVINKLLDTFPNTVHIMLNIEAQL